jgi:hypothetical protein
MPIFVLYVKCDLENVEEMTVKAMETSWCLTVTSPNGADVRERITADPTEEIELEGSRGTAHFAARLDGAKKAAHLVVTSVKGLTKSTLTEEDSGEFVPVIAFDCRGLEPLKWHPTDEFVVRSANTGKIMKTDLREGDWTEWDEDAEQLVSVTDLQWKFELKK